MKLGLFLKFCQIAEVPDDAEVYVVKDETQEMHYIAASVFDKAQNVLLLSATSSGVTARPVGQDNSPDPSKLN